MLPIFRGHAHLSVVAVAFDVIMHSNVYSSPSSPSLPLSPYNYATIPKQDILLFTFNFSSLLSFIILFSQILQVSHSFSPLHLNHSSPQHTHTHTPVSYTHLDVYKRQYIMSYILLFSYIIIT